MEQNLLVKIAKEILEHTCTLSLEMSARDMPPPPGLDVDTTSNLWTTHDSEIDGLRSTILALAQNMTTLLQGPHEFLHEYVSRNWEHGALYAILEFDVLEKIPLFPGTVVPIEQLASQTGLPREKLLRVCRLIATTGILREPEEGKFAHTAISRKLVDDPGYKSFIGFQLFETRVASAHLADSLQERNPFWAGKSAFEFAWGMPMYDWHARHPEKGRRFADAMRSVSKGFDAGDGMIIDWIRALSSTAQTRMKIFEVQGGTGSFSCQLAGLFPDIRFEVQHSSLEPIEEGKAKLKTNLDTKVSFRQRDLYSPRASEEIRPAGLHGQTVFLLRGVLWNLDDEQVIALLQSFSTVMGCPEKPRLLVSDLVSPSWSTFAPHLERAYRRRDVTLMTMHNVKQRSTTEWNCLIAAANPLFRFRYEERYTSHSCRGLWEIQMDD